MSDENTQIFNIYKEIEFYSLKTISYPKIACVMMVKNEEKRIKVSLDSVKDIVCCYIIFDTGSEDSTKDIIVNHCKDISKNLYMIHGNFIDFSTSRNTLIKYAEKQDIDYLLLLDTNDELKGGDKLLTILKTDENIKKNDAVLIRHQWWCGNGYQDYYNCRLFKKNCNWRYKGVVHELLSRKGDNGEEEYPYVQLNREIILYQDRTLDDDKSYKRFFNDKKLLYKEYKKDKKNPRTLYYLAQTYGCLKEYNKAYNMYKKRFKIDGGYLEERFLAAMRCGEFAELLKFSIKKQLYWNLAAYEICDRAEPLIKLSRYYERAKKWNLAYMYAFQACSLPDPVEFTFVVDHVAYNYHRWSQLGIVAYYYNKFEVGKNACLSAIQKNKDSNINIDIDKYNLRFYLEHDKKKLTQPSKQEYFNLRNKSLRESGKMLTNKQINIIIKKEWKDKKLVL